MSRQGMMRRFSIGTPSRAAPEDEAAQEPEARPLRLLGVKLAAVHVAAADRRRELDAAVTARPHHVLRGPGLDVVAVREVEVLVGRLYVVPADVRDLEHARPGLLAGGHVGREPADLPGEHAEAGVA